VYDTLPETPPAEGLEALRRGVHYLTFTSPSTVYNFMALTQQAGLNPLALPRDPRVVCIGPITAQAAREAGFRVDGMANPYTIEGLVEAIVRLQRRSSVP
jgi:uroporphyrinogen III methyltransferase/synthase